MSFAGNAADPCGVWSTMILKGPISEMRLLIVTVVTACAFVALSPRAMCQEQTDQIHMNLGVPNFRVFLVASSMERDESSNYRLTHLEGNVKVTAKALTPKKGGTKGEMEYLMTMILHADEADYDDRTGEINARGNVSVKFQTPLQKLAEH